MLVDPDDSLKDLYSGFLAGRELVVSPIAVGEKLVAISRLNVPDQRDALRILDSIPRLGFREDIPAFYARLWLNNPREHKHNDLWIAAFSMAHNFPLVSHDRDLVNLNGTSIEGRILRVYSQLLGNLGQPGSDLSFHARDHLSKDAISLDLSGEGDFIRERLAHPQACAQSSFRTINQGKGHKLVLCCPQRHWHTRHCDVSQIPQSRLHPRSEERLLVREALDLGIPVLQEASQQSGQDGAEFNEESLKSQINEMVRDILDRGVPSEATV